MSKSKDVSSRKFLKDLSDSGNDFEEQTSCSLCGKSFKGKNTSGRTLHLKTCGQQIGVEVGTLIKLRQLESKQLKERKELLGFSPSTTSTTITNPNKSKAKKLQNSKTTKVSDVGLELALALSASLTNEPQINQITTFKGTFESYFSSDKVEDILTSQSQNLSFYPFYLNITPSRLQRFERSLWNLSGSQSHRESYISEFFKKKSEALPLQSSDEINNSKEYFPSSSLSEDYLKLINDSHFSDLKIYVKNEEFLYGHSIVFWARNKLILKDVIVENDTIKYLFWSEVSLSTAILFLKYIYGHQFPSLEEMEASTTELEPLKDLCKKYNVKDFLVFLTNPSPHHHPVTFQSIGSSTQNLDNLIEVLENESLEKEEEENLKELDSMYSSPQKPLVIQVQEKEQQQQSVSSFNSSSDMFIREEDSEEMSSLDELKVKRSRMSSPIELPSPVNLANMSSFVLPSEQTSFSNDVSNKIPVHNNHFSYVLSPHKDFHEINSHDNSLLHNNNNNHKQNDEENINDISSFVIPPEEEFDGDDMSSEVFRLSKENVKVQTPTKSNTSSSSSSSQSSGSSREENSRQRVSRRPTSRKPNYEQMLSPALRIELDKYGLKIIPRNKACKLLHYIYEETHKNGEVEEFSSTSEESFGENEFLSSGQGRFELKDSIKKFIQSDSSLLSQVLSYEPLWLETFIRDFKASIFWEKSQKCTENDVKDILDSECITFRTAISTRRNKKNKK